MGNTLPPFSTHIPTRSPPRLSPLFILPPCFLLCLSSSLFISLSDPSIPTLYPHHFSHNPTPSPPTSEPARRPSWKASSRTIGPRRLRANPGRRRFARSDAPQTVGGRREAEFTDAKQPDTRKTWTYFGVDPPRKHLPKRSVGGGQPIPTNDSGEAGPNARIPHALHCATTTSREVILAADMLGPGSEGGERTKRRGD